MKQKKYILFSVAAVVFLLAAAFFGGGNEMPVLNGGIAEREQDVVLEQQPAPSEESPAGSPASPAGQEGDKGDAANRNPAAAENEKEVPAAEQGTAGNHMPSAAGAPETQKDPEGAGEKEAVPADHSSEQPAAGKHCTISISCKTLVKNEALPEEKRSLVPADGWLLQAKTVEFDEGESVFDVLSRVTKAEKIHMESAYTPLYDNQYIEGIGNLYELDAGSGSGWMYCVNGNFPNYGCNAYAVQDGDSIAFLYTCDLGADIGAKTTP